MNRMILDHDALNERDRIGRLAEKVGSCTLFQLTDGSLELSGNESGEGEEVRCVLVTKLQGGWHKYQVDLIQNTPGVHHWVVAVIDDVKRMEQETIRSQFGAYFAELDSYAELCFDGTEDLSELKRLLDKPVKTGKNLLVASLNEQLAAECAGMMKRYLPEWQIRYEAAPDQEAYEYQDAVLMVGEKAEDMALQAPGFRIKGFFVWLNQPLYVDVPSRRQLIAGVTDELNDRGWNIADYASCTFVSAINQERAKCLIDAGEMHPVALVNDNDFVMWDGYGLPLAQSRWTTETILDFLKKNCTLDKIAGRIK